MLNDAQAQHGEHMQEFLAHQIAAAGGWLSFEQYMDMALYAPGLGYYSAVRVSLAPTATSRRRRKSRGYSVPASRGNAPRCSAPSAAEQFWN